MNNTPTASATQADTNKPQHTPGPWETSKHATPEHSPQYGVNAAGDHNDLAIFKGPNAKANSQLAASAPDLLEALQELVALGVARNMHKAEAAIAKAKASGV